MNVKILPTMSWSEAPETITPEIYAKIRGKSEQWARNKFKEKNFPRIEGKTLIADKVAVRLYDMRNKRKNK